MLFHDHDVLNQDLAFVGEDAKYAAFLPFSGPVITFTVSFRRMSTRLCTVVVDVPIAKILFQCQLAVQFQGSKVYFSAFANQR